MTPSDLSRFRRMCGRFRWLAVLMTVTVGLVVVATTIVVPLVSGIGRSPDDDRRVWGGIVHAISPLFYLYGVWSVGQAMGNLSRGQLFARTVANALRRVGLSLGLGGVFSVFVATNLLRIIEQSRGGYLHFDVAGMTLGMIGGALFLFGRVLDQAGAVQAELDEMI